VTHLRHYSIAILSIVALGACAKKDAGTTDSATASSTAPSAVDSTASSTTSSTSSGGLSDANILAQEHGGDSAEVVIGRFASTHASDASVKAYANLLVSDHGKGQREVEALEKKLAITPQAPPDDTVAQETAHTLEHLGTLKGRDFDTAFVAHEIQDHQTDIADARKASAAAQLPEVKTLVDKSLPELQKHLNRGQSLAKKLGIKAS
jgi:putative membrane protein